MKLLAKQLNNVHVTVQNSPDPQFFPLIEVWYYFVHTCMCMTRNMVQCILNMDKIIVIQSPCNSGCNPVSDLVVLGFCGVLCISVLVLR